MGGIARGNAQEKPPGGERALLSKDTDRARLAGPSSEAAREGTMAYSVGRLASGVTHNQCTREYRLASVFVW